MSVTRWVLLVAAVLLIVVPPSPEFLESTVAFGFELNGDESFAVAVMPVVVGGLIVFLFFWRRFNEWPSDAATPDVSDFLEAPPSYCTTWGRYQVYHIFYTGVAIAIYLLIVRFPFLVELVVEMVQAPSDTRAFAEPGQDPAFDTEMSAAAAAGYAAAFMIGVWTSLPILGERLFRAYCHESAAVPREARNRINQFHSGRSLFSPGDDAIERVLRTEVGDFLSRHAFRPENDDGWSIVARAEYMLMQIDGETNDRFTRARGSHTKELRRVRGEIRDARQRATRLIQEQRRAISKLQDEGRFEAPDEGTLARLKLDHYEAELLPAEAGAAPIFKQDFTQREKALLDRYRRIYTVLLRIMVTTTLAAFRSEKERRLQIQRLGFQLTGEPQELIPKGAIPISVVTGFLVIAIPTFAFWLIDDKLNHALPWLIERGGLEGWVELPPSGERPRQAAAIVFVWPLIGAIMHTLAICAAFIMVRCGVDDVVEFRARPRTERERWDEMTTGFIGGFFINVVLMVLMAIVTDRPETIQQSGPWALVPAVTGAFLARHLASAEKSRLNVLALALGQGLITAAVAVALTFFLSGLILRAVPDVLVFGIYAALASGLAGTAFGLLFPMLARVGPHEEEGGVAEARTLAGERAATDLARWAAEGAVRSPG